jgi:hypothetical protein
MIFKRKTWIRRHKTKIKAIGKVITPVLPKAITYLISNLRRSTLYTLDTGYRKQVDLERKKILDKCKREFSRE